MSEAASDDQEGDASEESEAASVAVLECEVEAPSGPEWGSEEWNERKEAVKLAFIAGKATLAALSIKYGISYKTVQNWSQVERWGEAKEKLAVRIEGKFGDNLVDWLAKEKEKQIRRALTRSERLQRLSEEAEGVARASEDGLRPVDVQALAAEEKADNMARRNLGMDGTGGGGGSQVSVNIVASGGVQFS
jgi:hypothetical protein